MTEPVILTAAEMEKLSPNDRAAAVRERMVTDVNANPELVAWARARYRAMFDETEEQG